MDKWKYLFPHQSSPYNFRNKEHNVDIYVQQMLARTQVMFEYEGLPETIPQRMLELYLQTNGSCIIADYEGKLYAFTGGLGGEPDVYYRPTIYTVANPALNMSEMYKINENCSLILSDSMMLGFLPMFERYATAISENDLSLYIADINLRIMSLISAEDDRTAKAGQMYLDDIEKGKLGVIAESAFIGGLKVQPFMQGANGSLITQLIELQQYLKASWYNDIGIQSNYNMKREAIGADESALQYDGLLPLVDDMLNCRKEGIDSVNRMFGTNITVKLSSAWEDRQQKIEKSINDVDNAEEVSASPSTEEGGHDEPEPTET